MRKNNSKGTSVEVRDGNVNVALRKLKKKLDESNKIMDVLERQHYIKPTEERKRRKGAARARWLKKLADQALPKKLF